MSWLLDVNFLLASRWTTHADHAAVRAWFLCALLLVPNACVT